MLASRGMRSKPVIRMEEDEVVLDAYALQGHDAVFHIAEVAGIEVLVVPAAVGILQERVYLGIIDVEIVQEEQRTHFVET